MGCPKTPGSTIMPTLRYKNARAAGATIAMPLKAEDYGGKNYSCRDVEGYLWNFGSYDPWAEPAD